MANAKSITGVPKADAVKELNEIVPRYMSAKESADTASKLVDGTKQDLKAAVEEYGTELQDGSKRLELEQFNLDLKKRNGPVLLADKVKEILKPKGLYKDVLTAYVDQAKVEQLYNDGMITKKELAQMIENKPNFAFYCTEKK